jgi:hypothetical protein
MIVEIENAIIERLQAKIDDLKIESYPDKPEKKKLLHPKGQVLVHYYVSDYSEPFSGEHILQVRKFQFMVTVTTRSLHSHEGAYEYLDSILDALTGYQIEGCKKMYPIKDMFIDAEEGIWVYGVIFEVKAKIIEVSDDD